jgi:oxygen-dependent protoporphyrinogen oxidase
MRVGVIGAGITGLALTHYLAERGVDCLTLEADAEPGGVMHSERVDGVVLEHGPQRLRLTPGIETMVEAGDLDAAVIEAEELPMYVYADGQLGEVPFERLTFLTTDLLSWRGKARLLAEPLTRSGRPDESIATVFRRKFGEEAYRNLFGPLYGGIYSSNPAEMPARHALDSLLDAESEYHSLLRAFRQRVGGGRQFPPASFDDGLQALPRALADRYEDRIRLGTPATMIEPEGDRFSLHTPNGVHTVDHVVLTTPASTSADLLDGLASGMDALRALTYNPLAAVYLRADLDRVGLGYQVGYGEALHTLGVSWNASMLDRDRLYTAFLGGMHDPAVLERDDDDLGELAASEFEAVTGAAASVIDVHRLDPGFPAWDGSWDGLERVETPPGIHLATNYTERMGIPSRVREARDLAENLAGEA